MHKISFAALEIHNFIMQSKTPRLIGTVRNSYLNIDTFDILVIYNVEIIWIAPLENELKSNFHLTLLTSEIFIRETT